MTQPQTVLSFDTSGPFCDVALLQGERLIAQAHAEMARGQAERLMPMIADLMGEAGIGRRDLSAVGVGIGPGNFTGLRIAVAAARGLALGLGVPAIGVSTFEAIIEEKGLHTGPVLIALPAPRGEHYVQRFEDGTVRGAAELWTAQRLAEGDAGPVIKGKLIGLEFEKDANAQPVTRYASAIARIAQRRLGASQPEDWAHPANRPAPLYIKAPDALPSRHMAPRQA
ncbi:MAG: tRNA (adenosine(37)-N6)-threonylcarbamoyltransferase complex dimerization subunit type 1 TsaB [Pseudomonadota bacterium]